MKQRIQTIDALRGLVMIIMALDHIRDFFHFDAFTHDPTNLGETSYLLFLTRWVTHFCAPAFIFLTGLSAYLYGSKHSRNELSRYLLTRGLWLILLELTLFAFGWFMKVDFTHPVLMVIWAIGISMVFLALISRLPYALILTFGLLVLFLHNATDGVHFAAGTVMDDVWKILHVQSRVEISPSFRIMVLYPILPYLGLICLGYAGGKLFTPETDAVKRKKILLWTGLSSITLFILIRFTNLYGDPQPWQHQESIGYTLLSFINCNKYPVSLLFALMTLGPAILFLWLLDGVQNVFVNFLVVIGKVPMFYYILHLYLIRGLALITERQGTTPMGMHGVYHLWTIYLIWAGVIAALYYPCKWYGRYKSAHPEYWLLGYL